MTYYASGAMEAEGYLEYVEEDDRYDLCLYGQEEPELAIYFHAEDAFNTAADHHGDMYATWMDVFERLTLE